MLLTSRTPAPVRAVTAAAALALLLVAVAVTLRAGAPNEARWHLLGLIGCCWVAFALAAVALLRTPARAAVPLLLFGAVALQGLAVSVPPQLTDDYFRYAWDGRVQAAGIDPYRYPPVDPALAPLRTEWLFPSPCPGAPTPPPAHAGAPGTSTPDASTPDAGTAACTRMNHPGSPTIYPPVAQAWFWVLHQITRPLGPDGGGALTLQVAAAGIALATTVALLLLLRRRGDPRRAVLWAWCPTVVLEAGNNAHVDVLAALLVVLALGAALAGRPWASGVATGAAVAAKLLPVLILPALLLWWLRRRPAAEGTAGRSAAARWVGGVATVLVVGYVPHVLAVGPRALGFLPGYLAEEGFDGERRFALLRLAVPERAAAAVAVLVALGTAAILAHRAWHPLDHTHRAWRAGDARPAQPAPRQPVPWEGVAVLVGVTFTVVGITYPWYALLLVALVALDGRAEWLAVAAAAYPGYFTAALDLRFADTQRAGYGAALAVVLAATLWRSRQGRDSFDDLLVVLRWHQHRRPPSRSRPCPAVAFTHGRSRGTGESRSRVRGDEEGPTAQPPAPPESRPPPDRGETTTGERPIFSPGPPPDSASRD